MPGEFAFLITGGSCITDESIVAENNFYSEVGADDLG